jgi:hypothetical protein
MIDPLELLKTRELERIFLAEQLFVGGYHARPKTVKRHGRRALHAGSALFFGQVKRASLPNIYAYLRNLTSSATTVKSTFLKLMCGEAEYSPGLLRQGPSGKNESADKLTHRHEIKKKHDREMPLMWS